MAEGLLPPDEGDVDELDAEDLEDVLGGLGAPLDETETNSGCVVNGNCSCTK